MAVVDEISPSTCGEDRIGLTLSQSTPKPTAFEGVVIEIDYDRCAPEGVMLPLELVIVGPSGVATYQRRVFRRFAPIDVAFRPREGGPHLVRLGEAHHNRWYGALTLDVAGNRLTEGT